MTGWNGPFILFGFSPQVIALKRNPRYWPVADVHIGTVRELAYDSQASVLAGIGAG